MQTSMIAGASVLAVSGAAQGAGDALDWAAEQTPPDTAELKPKAVVTVTPATIDQLPGQANAAQPGTHFILKDGTYDAHNLRLRGVGGTAADPIVIRAENQRQAIFAPSGWDVGEFGAILSLIGEHIIIDGLRFEGGGGRQLLVYSSPSMVSHHITVRHCQLTRSWRHSLLCQGDHLTFEDNELTDNCQFNATHTRGVWPCAFGTWWFRDKEDAPSRECKYVVFRRNRVVGNPAKGIDIWVEQTGDCPFVANERIQILDNVIDGGAAKGVLYGIYWHKERRMLDVPEHTYSDVHIRGNTIRNTKAEKILFMLPPGRKPENCRIDVALDAPGVKVSPEDAWTQW